MREHGLFDEMERLEELTKLGDPLIVLAEKIDWESFRPILKQIRIENSENIKNAGRKPYDEVRHDQPGIQYETILPLCVKMCNKRGWREQ